MDQTWNSNPTKKNIDKSMLETNIYNSLFDSELQLFIEN